MVRTGHTEHCTLQAAHYTLHTTRYPLHITHSNLHSTHCILNTSFLAVDTQSFTLHTTSWKLNTSNETITPSCNTLHPRQCLANTASVLHNINCFVGGTMSWLCHRTEHYKKSHTNNFVMSSRQRKLDPTCPVSSQGSSKYLCQESLFLTYGLSGKVLTSVVR